MLVENPIINTYYFIEKNKVVKSTDKFYNTICPDTIDKIVNSNIICNNKFTINYNKVIEDYKTLYFYVLFDDTYIFKNFKDNKYDIYEWLKIFWNKPFLISNPIYKKNNITDINKLCFSNIKCSSIELNNCSKDEEYNQIIKNGCFSIGNGLIIGLYFVSSGYWKEKDFINALIKLIDDKVIKILFNFDNTSQTLYFFTKLYDKWVELFNIYPYQIIDNIFKYSFIFNSPNIYNFIYSLSNIEDNIKLTYSTNNNIYLTSIFSYVKTKHQYKFLINNKSLINSYIEPLPYNLYDNIEHYTFNYYNRFNNIVNSNKLYKYFKNCNKSDVKLFLFQKCKQINIDTTLFNIVKTVSYLYPKYNKHKKKRLENIWRKINHVYNNKIIKILQYYFIYNIIFNREDLLLPIKLFKINIFTNNNFSYFKPFIVSIYYIINNNSIPIFLEHIKENDTDYKSSWKEIFKYLNDKYNISEYKSLIENKIIKKLMYLERITNNDKNPHYYCLNEVIKYNYYIDNKDELWK